MNFGDEIYRTRDQAGEINVYQTTERRTLCFGSSVEQSAMSLADPALLLFDYTRAMMLGALFAGSIRHALVLGLGGGSLTRCMHAHFPGCRVTAVEQREEVAQVAQDWFALPRDDRLGVRIGDAVSYLSEPGKPADLIFADLYQAEGMDEQQTDRRFFLLCRQRLAEGGVAVFNLWSGRYFRDQEIQQAMDEVFDGQLLRLNVSGRNRIVFAFAGKVPPLPRKAFTEQAQQLGLRLGFPLLREAHRLWELNGAKLS